MTYALISTVKQGPVIKRSEVAGDPNPAKGFKWIPDNPPPFDPKKQTRTQGQEIPTDATEVPYTVSNIPLATIKANKLAAIRRAFEKRGNALVSGYAPSERETWPEQVKAAEAYDPAGQNTYLAAMLREGETVEQLATKILANRDGFLAASAALVKRRRDLDAEIESAATPEEVLSVDPDSGWPF